MTMVMIMINLLQVWSIRLQVTNNLVTVLHIPKLQSVHLILILPLGHERFAVLSDNIKNK